MNKEKQIEEMAKTMCKNYGGCSKCMFFPSCDVKSFAMRLHENGYRKAEDIYEDIYEGRIEIVKKGDNDKLKKASEVAEEIFAEIDTLIVRRMIADSPFIDDRLIRDIAKLKKKYTESEKDNE